MGFSCAKCLWWIMYAKNESQKFGFCKRFPPIVDVATPRLQAVFPTVSSHEFCGEFKDDGINREE